MRLLLLMLLSLTVDRSHSLIRIGAIFGKHHEHQKRALEFSVKQLNTNQSNFAIISAEAAPASITDSLVARDEVCRLLSLRSFQGSGPGVGAIIGSMDGEPMALVKAACSLFKMPLIQTMPDECDTTGERSYRLSLNLHPTMEDLGVALMHFIKAYDWKTFALIYDSSRGWRQQENLFDEIFKHRLANDSPYDVAVYKLEDGGMDSIFKRIKDGSIPYRRLIVDISSQHVKKFLMGANSSKILTDNRHFMFTSLDLESLDVSEHCAGGVNVTGFRLIDPSVKTSEQAKYLVDDWTKFYGGNGGSRMMFQTHQALIIDAVHLFSNAYYAFVRRPSPFVTTSLQCSSQPAVTWGQGASFYDTLRFQVFRGLSGDIHFDEFGQRVNISLDLIGFDTEGKIEKMGIWTASKGFEIVKSEKSRNDDILKGLWERRLRVVVKKEEPFVMQAPELGERGKSRFYGYCIDMLDKLADNFNFTYDIHVVNDGKTGNAENGTWNGMIGELIRGEADLALSSLTITAERSNVIDFTAPFMHLGISILFKKPTPKEPDLFSFLLPLHFKIWICIIFAILAFTVAMFLFARFGPYEWKNTHPCHPEVEIIENEFTLMNSFWFVIASFLQQGSEEAPKASSLRVIAGVWWFFCMIMVSSYTANLAAFLTVSRMGAPIESARDLSQQTLIKYGCYYGGATRRFFEKSTISVYQTMWNFMETYKDDVMLDTSEGVQKVKKGDYAYLMESIPLRYQLTQHCDLMEVGQDLDSKFYGIGLPKGSPYTNLFSDALINLNDAQVLSSFYNKWWKVEDSECATESTKPDIVSQSQLGVTNFGGLYLFLTAGVAFSFLVGIFEFFVANIVDARENKASACTQITEDSSFAVNCCGQHKKLVIHNRNVEDQEPEKVKERKVPHNNTGSHKNKLHH